MGLKIPGMYFIGVLSGAGKRRKRIPCVLGFNGKCAAAALKIQAISSHLLFNLHL